MSELTPIFAPSSETLAQLVDQLVQYYPQKHRKTWVDLWAEEGEAQGLDFLRKKIAEVQQASAAREARRKTKAAEKAARATRRPETREEFNARRLARAIRIVSEAKEKGVMLTGRKWCLICSRGFTDPVSKAYGIGPECSKAIRFLPGSQEFLACLVRVGLGVEVPQ